MYKKAIMILIGAYLSLGVLFWNCRSQVECVQELPIEEENRRGSQEIVIRKEGMGIAAYSSSDRRIVDYAVIEHEEAEAETHERGQTFSEEEIQVLQRIVEAEAGGEDETGKLLVANVVLNRVNCEDFPDSITKVVYQRSNGVTQFSPVKNGKLDSVVVSEESKRAVERALQGEDVSKGALYFAARKYANQKSMKWFDDHLIFLFQHGGHEFFK